MGVNGYCRCSNEVEPELNPSHRPKKEVKGMTTITLYAEDWLWDDYSDSQIQDILDLFDFHVTWAYPDPYSVTNDYAPAVLNTARDANVVDKRDAFKSWLESTGRWDSSKKFHCCLVPQTSGAGGLGGGSHSVGVIDPFRADNLPSTNQNWIVGSNGGIDLAIALQEIGHTFSANHDMGWSVYDDFDFDGTKEQRTTPMTFRYYDDPNYCGNSVAQQQVSGGDMQFSVGYSTCAESNASFPHSVTDFTYPTGD